MVRKLLFTVLAGTMAAVSFLSTEVNWRNQTCIIPLTWRMIRRVTPLWVMQNSIRTCRRYRNISVKYSWIRLCYPLT